MPYKTISMLVLLLGTIALICQWLRAAINEKPKLIRRAAVIVALFVVIPAAYEITVETLSSSRFDKEKGHYAIHLNQTKSANSTKIKLKSVFMDLMKIEGTYSICGKEKLVAIELKEDPGDVGSICTMDGMWEGRRLIPKQGAFGMSYQLDRFIDPVYVVFYLSSGDSITFEVKDKFEVQKQVKIIDVNKSVKFMDSFINFTKLNKGLSYSTLNFELDFMPANLEIIIEDGNTSKVVRSGWGGSGDKYSGGVSFDPIKSKKLLVKVKDTSSNKEVPFEVDINGTP